MFQGCFRERGPLTTGYIRERPENRDCTCSVHRCCWDSTCGHGATARRWRRAQHVLLIVDFCNCLTREKEPNRGSQGWHQQQFSHPRKHRTALYLFNSRTTLALNHHSFCTNTLPCILSETPLPCSLPSVPPGTQPRSHPTYHHWVPPDVWARPASFVPGHSPRLLCEVHQRRRHFCWKVLAKLENPEDEEEWFRVNSGHFQNLWCSALSHITFFCISARTGGGNENTFIPYILLDKKHTAYPFGVSLLSYTEWKNEV